jgi:hypothetical protein
MFSQEPNEKFSEKVKGFWRNHYETIAIRIPIIVGTISIVFSLMSFLAYGVSRERLDWLASRHYPASSGVVIYFTEQTNYFAIVTIFLVLSAIALFTISYFSDRRK